MVPKDVRISMQADNSQPLDYVSDRPACDWLSCKHHKTQFQLQLYMWFICVAAAANTVIKQQTHKEKAK